MLVVGCYTTLHFFSDGSGFLSTWRSVIRTVGRYACIIMIHMIILITALFLKFRPPRAILLLSRLSTCKKALNTHDNVGNKIIYNTYTVLFAPHP